MSKIEKSNASPTDALKKGKWPQAEADVGKVVVGWLGDLGWDVYQEVTIGYGGKCADIVAVNGPISWIIEVKKSMSVKLMDQAMGWRGFANYVSMAIPGNIDKPNFSRNISGVESYIVARLGLGRLVVFPDDSNYPHKAVNEYSPPSIMRKAADIRPYLKPEHKMCIAGASSKNQWSAFKNTSKKIVEYVKKHPGCGLNDIQMNVQHHWSSSKTMKSVVPKYIRDGVISGIRIDRSSRTIKLYPGSMA